MACVNDRHCVFHEMQLNLSIYRTKLMLIDWLNSPELALLYTFEYLN